MKRNKNNGQSNISEYIRTDDLTDNKVRKINAIACLFIILALPVLNISASYSPDNIRFERLQSENLRLEKGLSQNTVFSIIQDKSGYLWFGTWDGLNKYDGMQFSIYRPSHQYKEGELSDPTIYCIHVDRQNNLWLGTENGLNYYNRSVKSFISFTSNTQNYNTISNDTIRCIASDALGNIWVGTQNGLNVRNFFSGKWTTIINTGNENSLLPDNTIRDIYFDNKNRIWIATAKGIAIVNPLKKTVNHLLNDLDHDYDNIEQVWCLKPFPAKTNGNTSYMLAGSSAGLVMINTKDLSCEVYPCKPRSGGTASAIVSALEVDRAGTIWVGTIRNGLNIFNDENKTFDPFYNDPADLNSLSDDNVLSIFEDRQGILWVGTWIGVNKVRQQNLFFKQYTGKSQVKGGLNNDYILAIYQDEKGLIWIGTNGGGVNILNPATGEYTYLLKSEQKNSLSSNNIRCITKDDKGNMWIGTSDNGINIYQPATGEMQKINTKNNNSLPSDFILCLYEDNDENMWAGTTKGLVKINTNSMIVEPIPFEFTDETLKPSFTERIFDIIEDRSETLWLATYGGLIKFNRKTGQYKIYRHIDADANSISTNRLFSLYKDKNGYIWIGTMGGGLNKFEPEREVFKHYTTENGLPNNVIYNILEDRSENLWISTNYGLSEFNPKEKTFINYDIRDGLLSNEFNVGACFNNPISDEMFFGGLSGFVSFYPLELQQNQKPPNVVITSFKIRNQNVEREINDGDVIKLKHDENFLSIEFAALDFANPEKNLYRYILKDLDRNWIETGANRRIAEYTNLRPGNYTFILIAANNDGVWNKEGISLSIIIAPPWWSTWWFRILSILIITSTLWSIIYKRIAYIRNKHASEKRAIELERQALRLQMTPHFIFNSLNSIQSFIVNNASERASEYLAKFAKLMRLILYSSREKMVPISDEIESIKLYLELEKVRFDNKFSYSINYDKDIDIDFLAIPPMLIQPYIENAIIHGILHKTCEGHININIKKDDKILICSIEDNGIGRRASQIIREKSDIKHVPRGMLITDERLKLINQDHDENVFVEINDLYDEKNEAAGTRVVIKTVFEEI